MSIRPKAIAQLGLLLCILSLAAAFSSEENPIPIAHKDDSTEIVGADNSEQLKPFDSFEDFYESSNEEFSTAGCKIQGRCYHSAQCCSRICQYRTRRCVLLNETSSEE